MHMYLYMLHAENFSDTIQKNIILSKGHLKKI